MLRSRSAVRQLVWTLPVVFDISGRRPSDTGRSRKVRTAKATSRHCSRDFKSSRCCGRICKGEKMGWFSRYIERRRDPYLLVEVTRDSVCLGDDAGTPHLRKIRIPGPPADLAELVCEIVHTVRPYLPEIGQSTWVLRSNETALSLFLEERSQPYELDLSGLEPKSLAWTCEGSLHVHLEYCQQLHPSIVMKRLRSEGVIVK